MRIAPISFTGRSSDRIRETKPESKCQTHKPTGLSMLQSAAQYAAMLAIAGQMASCDPDIDYTKKTVATAALELGFRDSSYESYNSWEKFFGKHFSGIQLSNSKDNIKFTVWANKLPGMQSKLGYSIKGDIDVVEPGLWQGTMTVIHPNDRSGKNNPEFSYDCTVTKTKDKLTIDYKSLESEKSGQYIIDTKDGKFVLHDDKGEKLYPKNIFEEADKSQERVMLGGLILLLSLIGGLTALKIVKSRNAQFQDNDV